ncbi:acyl carrier protein [Plantactinospora sp. B6F1]|uniref:phosphopantetheine-binding protein n=1 Tax=Plantactinospora sp. B6F1 TaxID=3158971 RepID=UPI00102CCF9C
MLNRTFTIDDLRRILREAAGQDEWVDLDGDILDTGFDELGYDSLALLETGTRVEREFGIKIEDEALTSARTPRALLGTVNTHLASASAS